MHCKMSMGTRQIVNSCEFLSHVRLAKGITDTMHKGSSVASKTSGWKTWTKWTSQAKTIQLQWTTFDSNFLKLRTTHQKTGIQPYFCWTILLEIRSNKNSSVTSPNFPDHYFSWASVQQEKPRSSSKWWLLWPIILDLKKNRCGRKDSHQMALDPGWLMVISVQCRK